MLEQALRKERTYFSSKRFQSGQTHDLNLLNSSSEFHCLGSETDLLARAQILDDLVTASFYIKILNNSTRQVLLFLPHGCRNWGSRNISKLVNFPRVAEGKQGLRYYPLNPWPAFILLICSYVIIQQIHLVRWGEITLIHMLWNLDYIAVSIEKYWIKRNSI